MASKADLGNKDDLLSSWTVPTVDRWYCRLADPYLTAKRAHMLGVALNMGRRSGRGPTACSDLVWGNGLMPIWMQY